MADVSDRYPWPDRGRWVRAVMVMTLDGRIVGPDGRSGSISGPADRDVLLAIRRFADAVVIGASTFRAERYRPMTGRADTRDLRAAEGQGPAPRLVIVSASLDLPWEEPAFHESALTPLVVTVAGHPPDLLDEAGGHADVLVAGGPAVDAAWLVAELEARGLRRIACEGGHVLLESFARAGVVDEWNLTLSPLAAETTFRLEDEATQDGFLFTRYLRARP